MSARPGQARREIGLRISEERGEQSQTSPQGIKEGVKRSKPQSRGQEAAWRRSPKHQPRQVPAQNLLLKRGDARFQQLSNQLGCDAATVVKAPRSRNQTVGAGSMAAQTRRADEAG